MSKEVSSARMASRNTPRNMQPCEENENVVRKLSTSVHFPPPRSPLNVIPDPSQTQQEDAHDVHELDSADIHHVFDEKSESIDKGLRVCKSAGEGLSSTTPKVSAGGKVHLDSNLGQSTPGRSAWKNLNVTVGSVGFRPNQHSGGRLGSSSKASRRFTIVHAEAPIDVPHFELQEDPLFWKDHNVQVLIRVRPLSNIERISQGYTRCLRQDSPQTLAWLGHPEARFTFDHIAGETITQEKLFRVAGLPMVENCMSGYNSCIFAYGQTGSGKTYTMMGEIQGIEGRLSGDSGITPRLFEYLFARIKSEEESRREEKLTYSCKCSFLEIYNEQITDLLDPSSNNLQLREDMKKGVYVENLTEHNVRTVNDVLQLLLKGASNRKIAATYMNSESSRSHSVFTCIIESCWEKDSMKHIRFGRLNLVDLAGSERQKCSGAEGDRLKEAANINRSLSTLGLVIMSLVDMAHGKHRHVPYRDSRLTFLLQDSLGGNSKTTIIANVSPSICSSNETLSTLKFAQRAKLIQNNAKVNEDASDDVTALQQQIEELKGQLSFFLKHQTIPRSLSPTHYNDRLGLWGFSKHTNSRAQENVTERKNGRNGKSELITLETTVTDTCNKKKVTQTTTRRLEAEVEHLRHLALEREDEVQKRIMMIQLQQEKIRRLKLLVNGSLSSDKYLVEENKALLEENQHLYARVSRSEELARAASKNIRFLEQAKCFCHRIEELCEGSDHKTLLEEVSKFHCQLSKRLEETCGNFQSSLGEGKQGDTLTEELRGRRNMNLLHHSTVAEEEGDGFQTEVSSSHSAFVMDPLSREMSLNQSDQISMVETMSMRSDMGYESMSCDQVEEDVLPSEVDLNIDGPSIPNHAETRKGVEDARVLIEALEGEQVHLLEELKYMQDKNCELTNMISMGKIIKNANFTSDSCGLVTDDFYNGNRGVVLSSESNREASLQFKLDKMTHELEEATVLNIQYQEDQASKLCHQKEVELVRQHVEMEMAETMLNLQEEMAALQTELNRKLCYLTAENTELRNNIAAKDNELKDLSVKWERAIFELTNFLVDGTKSLKDASSHIDSIACLFPDVSLCVSGLVERAAKVCVDKDERILMLQRNLEDAHKMSLEMEQKLSSLRGATLALTQVKQLDRYACVEQPVHPRVVDKTVKVLESKFCYIDDQFNELLKIAIVAFLAMKRLSHCCDSPNDSNKDNDSIELGATSQMATQLFSDEVNPNELLGDVNDIEGNTPRLEQLELENAFCPSFADDGKPSSCFQIDLQKACVWSQKLVKRLIKGLHDLREKLKQLKGECRFYELCDSKMLSAKPLESIILDSQCHMLCQIRDGVSETNKSLGSIQAALDRIFEHGIAEDPCQSSGWSTDSSTSDSITSSSDAPLDIIMKATSDSCSSAFWVNMTEENLGTKCCLTRPCHAQEPREVEIQNDERIFFLQKEFQMAFESFRKVQTWLAALCNEKDTTESCHAESICVPDCHMVGKINQVSQSCKAHHQVEMSNKTEILSSSEARMEETDFAGKSLQEFTNDGKIKPASSFFAKFETAQATIEEADIIINALMKAKEDAQQLTEMWKQTEKEMKGERDGLFEQVLQLKSMLCMMTGVDDEVAGDKNNYGLEIVAREFFSLEDCFSDCQREVEDKLNKFHLDVLSMMEETQYCILCMRSLLENLFSEFMATNFASLVFCKSVEDCLRGLQNSNKHVSAQTFKWQRLCSEIDDEGVASALAQNTRQMQLKSDVTGTENQPHPISVVVYDENSQLRRKLERKEELLEGLQFDFSLLQESISDRKYTSDEVQQLVLALGKLKQEMEYNKSQLDDTMACYRKLEECLAVSENNLYSANSELEQIQRSLKNVSDEKVKLRLQVKDCDEQLQEQKEVIKGLEEVVLQLTSSTNKKISESLAEVEDDLRRVTRERDQLQEEVKSLNEKIELANTLAEENEAVAIEAHQDAETSKIYAQQKEEEVKILEHSIEELERTVNVLENKVHDMDEEVLRNRLSRNSVEQEVQAVRQRLLKVENLTSESIVEGQIQEQFISIRSNRLMDLNEAHNEIKTLEDIRGQQAKEIARLKEYVSELILHTEAQASQYQRKYKALEELVHNLQNDPSSLVSVTSMSSKSERSLSRTRGSSSPFRCISNLVNQMNNEKDQELSVAKCRIVELETLAESRQREVCMLNSRLAAAESMTHDVIRDLLGLKLDMTNYANLIDQQQLQRLLDVAQRQTLDSVSKEHEISMLRKQVQNLIQERESSAFERHRKEADMLAVHLTLEQLKERDQFLTVQNEMLKVEKTNLTMRLAEMERMVKVFERQNATQCSL